MKYENKDKVVALCEVIAEYKTILDRLKSVARSGHMVLHSNDNSIVMTIPCDRRNSVLEMQACDFISASISAVEAVIDDRIKRLEEL